MNRRTFIKKISSFALVAPLLAVLPFGKSEARAHDLINDRFNEAQALADKGWKTSQECISELDEIPNGHIYFLNTKLLKLKKN